MPPLAPQGARFKTQRMTELEFIEKIMTYVRPECSASEEALAVVTAAVAAFPSSAFIWLMHGRVTMAAPHVDVVDGAVRSFEMAIQLDPTLAEAHDGLGHYYDRVQENPERALKARLEAERLRCPVH